MCERIPLADMKPGERGTVIEVMGGVGMRNRLQALGIRDGVKVVKVSATFARGPVVVQVGSTQTALGFGVSYKIIVDVER